MVIGGRLTPNNIAVKVAFMGRKPFELSSIRMDRLWLTTYLTATHRTEARGIGLPRLCFGIIMPLLIPVFRRDVAVAPYNLYGEHNVTQT